MAISRSVFTPVWLARTVQLSQNNIAARVGCRIAGINFNQTCLILAIGLTTGLQTVNLTVYTW